MPQDLKQVIPSAVCLECDVCCRYPEKATSYAPYFFPEEIKKLDGSGKFYSIGKTQDPKTPPIPYKGCYICQFFIPEKNSCKIYLKRPLDCRIYPFMLAYDKEFKSVLLVYDTKCPFLKDKLNLKETRRYINYLAGMLEDESTVEKINSNKNFINDFQEDFIALRRLENLSKRICFARLGLNKIALKDKQLFDEYFAKTDTLLSGFSFASIYIWSYILNIVWARLNNALCIFAGNDKDYFLLAPPLDKGFNKRALAKALKVLSDLNATDGIGARIENIPEGLSADFADFGLKLKDVPPEYLYNRQDLAQLKGNRFKTKRALVNSFKKRYKYRYRNLEQKDAFDCLALYGKWARQRVKGVKDDYFKSLIEDSFYAQKTALLNYEYLGLQGRVVEIGAQIKAYTIGFSLNKDTFVILFETTDLKIRGLSQFIFREFCQDLGNYKYINTLSDSGLENLKKVKDSYRPVKKVLSFAAYSS